MFNFNFIYYKDKTLFQIAQIYVLMFLVINNIKGG